MITEEEMEKLQKEVAVQFFEKNFIGKEPNEALYNVMREGIIEICVVLGRFIMIKMCLQAIQDNESYFYKIDLETQKRIIECKYGVEIICEDLEKILDPILQGLKS